MNEMTHHVCLMTAVVAFVTIDTGTTPNLVCFTYTLAWRTGNSMTRLDNEKQGALQTAEDQKHSMSHLIE